MVVEKYYFFSAILMTLSLLLPLPSLVSWLVLSFVLCLFLAAAADASRLL